MGKWRPPSGAGQWGEACPTLLPEILGVVVILGYELDGTVQRDLPPAGAAAGVSAAGPQRLVDMLEQAYGMPAPSTTPLQRVLGYQQALEHCDDDRRFYSQSRRRDPLGVARAVLAARDELLMAAPSGWSLAALAGLGGRLADLAQIEEHAADGRVPPGLPDRLRALIDELAHSPIRPPITELQLTEDRRFWPPLMQELQFVLEFRGTRVVSYALPRVRRRHAARQPTDLARAQLALRTTAPGAGAPAAPAAPAADGSLALARAGSLVEAADAAAALIASWIRPRSARGKPGRGVCVVAEEHGEVLDAALLRAGIPPAGHTTPVRGGDAGGLLPLLLQLLWDPVDPRTMQRYLLLTLHPLPGLLRGELLYELDQMPGVWGPRWHAVIDRYLATVNAGRRDTVRARIDRWLPRPATEQALPVAAVIAHAGAVAVWARRHAFAAAPSSAAPGGNPPAAEAAQESAALADAVAAAAAARAEPQITRLELERLVSEVERAVPRQRRAQAGQGGPRSVSAAGALLSPVDHVLWWHAAESTVGSAPPSFFSTREGAALERLGVRLQARLLQIERREQQWRRLVQLARSSLVLVYATSHGDQVDAPHPLWFMLQQPFPRTAAEPGAPLIWPARAAGAPTAAGRPQTPRPALVPPPFTPRWQVPAMAGHLPRPTESATSLAALLGCPLHYVLQYRARVRPRRELGLITGNRLLGIVAHDVLAAHLAAQPNPVTGAAVAADLRERFAAAFAAVATLLRVPGMDRERAEVEALTIRAATALGGTLQAGGLEVVAVEQDYQAPQENGLTLQGRADLVVRRRGGGGGELVIIDLKWSGRRFYRRLLEERRALQLAHYATVAGAAHELPAPPPTAYFVITTAELFTVHAGLLPGAIVVPGPTEGELWQELWPHAQARRTALEAGTVDVGTPEAAWRQGLPERPLPAPCRFCDYGLFCGVAAAPPEGSAP